MIWWCPQGGFFALAEPGRVYVEAARQRIVVAVNRASAYNPSGLPVALELDGTLRDIPAGQTVSLVAV